MLRRRDLKKQELEVLCEAEKSPLQNAGVCEGWYGFVDCMMSDGLGELGSSTVELKTNQLFAGSLSMLFVDDMSTA